MRRLVGAALVAASLVLVTPIPARAINISMQASEVRSACSSWLPWRGSNQVILRLGSAVSKGSVRYCFRKLRVADSNPTKDFYVAVVQAEVLWTGERAIGAPDPRGLPAPSSITVTSSVPAIGNDYGASPTIDGRSCTGPVSVSVGYAGFGISVTPTICSGGRMNRDYWNSSGASWSTATLGQFSRWESTFVEAVPQGRIPNFSVTATYPTWTGVMGPTTPPQVMTNSRYIATV